jgi:LPS O-antigen subunit length determinant protein (WzzB/FepE family)
MSRSSSIQSEAYGYLSDVPPLYPHDEDYNEHDHTEVSSDWIESTKNLENQFQQRYQILKAAYEDRIKQLSVALEETCNEIASNEIIHSLKEDPTSLIFVPNFIQDILFSHLKSDREKYLLEVLSHEVELKQRLQKQKEICEEQNQRIYSLQEEVGRGKEAEAMMSSMKKQIHTLNDSYQEISEQARDEISTAVHQKEAAEHKEASLKEQLRYLTESLQVVLSFLFVTQSTTGEISRIREVSH